MIESQFKTVESFDWKDLHKKHVILCVCQENVETLEPFQVFALDLQTMTNYVLIPGDPYAVYATISALDGELHAARDALHDLLAITNRMSLHANDMGPIRKARELLKPEATPADMDRERHEPGLFKPEDDHG